MNRRILITGVVCVCLLSGEARLQAEAGGERVAQVYEDLATIKAVAPAKEYRLGVSGVCGSVKEDHILVTYVEPGSPADGQVEVGDLVRALQYRGVGEGIEGIRETVAKRIYRLGRDWDWHLYMTVERPALRGGKGNTLTFDMVMPRPNDSQYHFGPTGFFAKIDSDHLVVDYIAEGSPSDGKLLLGDHILAVDGKRIEGNVFKLFSECVDHAESEEGGGTLMLTVRRAAAGTNDSGSGIRDSVSRIPQPASRSVAETLSVELHLKVLGSYSKTSPIDCPKTDAIITQTADSIIKRASYGRIDVGLLALLSTGEKKYIEHVGKVIHEADWAKPDIQLPITGSSVSWHRAYITMTLCEYYLLTGNEYVLPAIKAYANIIAMGQDSAGLWNHQSANPAANFGISHGRLYGYGAINQTSIALWISLILAEECGVKDPEVRAAVEKTYQLYSYWIERGKLPYGNHDAGEDFFTNNGTSGSVAVGFALLGDKKGARFFSQMSAAAGREVLTGHTGPWFNIFWSGIGANVSGPELTKAYDHELHWLRTVTRTWDDRFLHMEAWGCNPGDYGLGSSSAYLLNLSAGRRKLRITGRDMDTSIWLDSKDAQEVVAAGNINYSSLTVKDLLGLLGNTLPPVRLRASEMLAIKDADVSDEVMDLLARGTREQRIGAIHAISALKISSALDTLMSIVRDAKDDLWIRQLALRTMTSLDGSRQYVPELLAMLVADKTYDIQGRFDEGLGSALVQLTDSDPYSANLDKDLLYKAVNKLLDHKRQEARGCGMSLVKNIPIADLKRVADKMIYVIEDKDRTYVSYHGDSHRQAGLDILYRLNIKEAIDLCVNTIKESTGRGWRERARVEMLNTFGAEAKYAIPKIKEVLGEKADEIVKQIEAAKSDRKMISLEEAKKAGAGGSVQ